MLSEQDLATWQALEDRCGADAFLSRVPKVIPVTPGEKALTPHHLRPLARAVARVRRGEKVRMLLGIPPRHSKSWSLLSAPSWLWEKRAMKIIYTTYSGHLAAKQSWYAQQMAVRTGWRVSGTKAQWRVQHGGEFNAAGIGGSITGFGADLLIIDDPFPNRQAAESAVIRDSVMDEFNGTLMRRLEPNASVIVLHHRWHPDDLIGQLSKQPGWENVKLPAIRVEDGVEKALWEERWSLEEMRYTRANTPPYDWASLYQQEPQPRGSQLFREPALFDLPLKPEQVRGAFILGAADPAATAKVKSDRSALLVGLATLEEGKPVLYLLDGWAGREEVPDFAARIARVSQNWQCPFGIEAVGGFKAVPQIVRRLDPKARLVELNPVGDKFTRALPASQAWNDGRIRLPRTAPWRGDMTEEVCRFTGQGDLHDDWVDAVAHLFDMAEKMLRRPSAPGSRTLRSRTINSRMILPFG